LKTLLPSRFRKNAGLQLVIVTRDGVVRLVRKDYLYRKRARVSRLIHARTVTPERAERQQAPVAGLAKASSSAQSLAWNVRAYGIPGT